MAKIHVLSGDQDGNYRIVIHANVPGGNNSVGRTWSSVIVASGRNTSILTEGTGVGQISTAELASITAGNVIEFTGSIKAESGGATMQSLDDLANQIIADEFGRLAKVYKFYGHTQNDQGA